MLLLHAYMFMFACMWYVYIGPMFGQICAWSDAVCVTPWQHFFIGKASVCAAPRNDFKRKRNMPKPQRLLLRWYESQLLQFPPWNHVTSSSHLLNTNPTNIQTLTCEHELEMQWTCANDASVLHGTLWMSSLCTTCLRCVVTSVCDAEPWVSQNL